MGRADGQSLREHRGWLQGVHERHLAESCKHVQGVGSMGASATVATSAAIKWITKDGIGAFGRFLVRCPFPFCPLLQSSWRLWRK